MSDAKLGGDSPERPGMNAKTEQAGPDNSPQKPRSKNRRKRWRKRNKQSENGIQAENHRDAAAAGLSVGVAIGDAPSPPVPLDSGNAGPRPAKPDDNKSSFRSGSPGKRARRRGGRKRGKRVDADTPTLNSSAKEPVSAADGKSPNAVMGGNPVLDLHSSDPVQKGQEKQSSGNSRRNNRNRRRMPSRDGEKSNPATIGPTTGATSNQNGPNRPQTAARTPAPRTNKHRGDAYAALDLGTNNCRLLIAVPQQPGRFRVVDAFSRIVRLGEGLAASGHLSDAAMDRAVGALSACAEKLKNRNVRGVRLIATEACRRATNGQAFLERVESEAGLKLEIIDRETEAKLAVAGCASLVDRKARGVVLFDIGGGSSELALLDLDKRKRYDLSPAVVSWTSLPLGVVTLSEKHGGGKLVTRPVFEAMVAEVAELLMKFEGRDALAAASAAGEVHLLGTSGTVTTLAGIHLKLPRYDRRMVDGTWMSSADVDAMIDALVDMSFEERVSNPCIGRDRADLVLAGCAILVAIQRLWPCERLRVADRGLREGLLTEMMNADNAWIRRPKYFRSRSN